VPLCDQAQDQHGVLGGQDREEPAQRRSDAGASGGVGMDRDHGMGVRAARCGGGPGEAGCPGRGNTKGRGDRGGTDGEQAQEQAAGQEGTRGNAQAAGGP